MLQLSYRVISSALLLTLIHTSPSLAFDASALKKSSESAGQETSEPASFDEMTEDEKIEAGIGVYGSTCLFCHGPEGTGARAPSLVTGHWGPGGGNDDAYMYDVITNGREGTIMGSFRDDLSEKQIASVMTYLRHVAKRIASE